MINIRERCHGTNLRNGIADNKAPESLRSFGFTCCWLVVRAKKSLILAGWLAGTQSDMKDKSEIYGSQDNLYLLKKNLLFMKIPLPSFQPISTSQPWW